MCRLEVQRCGGAGFTNAKSDAAAVRPLENEIVEEEDRAMAVC